MPDGAIKTMDTTPTNTPPAGDVATEATPEVAPATSDSSSTTEAEDLTPLIEEEKKRGKPDPEKARERFLKKRKQEEEQHEVVVVEEKPITRAELERLLAEQLHRNTLENAGNTLVELSESLAETPQEAELIRSVHANRVYPIGMPLREQLEEAQVVANAKRLAAKNAELARKVQSQNTASRNTATTHRDPMTSLEPELAPDLKVSMQRSGYTFNSTSRRYEKKLPNGKTLVKTPGQPPYMVD